MVRSSELHNRYRRHVVTVIWLTVLTALLSLFFPLSSFASKPLGDPIVASEQKGVIARTDGVVSSYQFNLTLDQESKTISGTERIEFINSTGEPQTFIPFRLYPNADYYGEGNLEIIRARVEGESVSPEFSAQRSVMTLPLAKPLNPGESVNLALRFTVTVPIDSSGTFGIFSFDSERATWILADWYPILAGWEPGRGWVLDTPTPAGDPTFSETGTYDLRINMPANLIVAATGVETPEISGDGRNMWKIVTGPVREFTMVIDDDFVTTTRTVGETEVTLYTNGDGSGQAGGEIALDSAANALAVYSAAFGAYPYTELDLVETEMAGALGVSWTGLVFLNGAQFLSNSFYVNDEPERLRFTVAHETGHQWWGALVGINSNDHSFLLEGLTNYLAIYATEVIEGAEAANQQLMVQSVNPYLSALAATGDGIPDVSINEPSQTGPSRSVLVYGKAALGFLAIRQEIGDEAFLVAIEKWEAEFRFGIAGPEDLLTAFEAESGAELGDLWTFWFQSAVTTEADVMALLER